MSVEKAMIAQARPHMLAARARSIIQREIQKGCMPDLASHPLSLEPPYCPLSLAAELPEDQSAKGPALELPPHPNDILRLQIWISPDEEFSWLKSELFIKHLHSLSHRAGLEIIGNKQNIQMLLLAHQDDLPIIQTAFFSQFERSEITPVLEDPLKRSVPDSWATALFLDYFPPPPYSHLLTRPGELQVSTYRSLLAALMEIAPPAVGFYQVLFQPVRPEHDWHRNVQALLDLEYAIKLMSPVHNPQSYQQQAPSGDLHLMAREVETKAHNDKPFYSTAIRLGLWASARHRPDYLQALAIFMNLFQHGGRPLNAIREADYGRIMSSEEIRQMIFLGMTYRPGFLVNSSELTGLVHVPPANILGARQPPVTILETLPLRNPELSVGTPIGTCVYAGKETPVCIPPSIRPSSIHIIGKTGQTKSTTMGRMVLDDISKEMGVVVIDPHGDLVEALLCLIEEKYVEKTIYFNPGDPDYVPLWNPAKRCPGQDIGRTADDLVASIKSFVSGWGDRLEHLLRHGLYALLQLPDSTLFDLSNLLRPKTEESKRIREEILGVIENETAYQFWKHDFERYPKESFDPPKHKLSKLLVSGTVSLMLSQPESLIDFRRIMDEGMILLVNLSTLGSEVREILGSFILSLFHLAALGRSEVPAEQRKLFHIHVDEAHRFLRAEALEDLLVETRKYQTSISMAHHYLSQFGTKKIDALSNVGTTIIMNVDGKDARYLTKDLLNQVQDEDLVNLKKGEAIARIGTDVVRIKTPGPLEIPPKHFKETIIERSRRLYYRPVQVVQKAIFQKSRQLNPSFLPLTEENLNPEDFVYDEF